MSSYTTNQSHFHPTRFSGRGMQFYELSSLSTPSTIRIKSRWAGECSGAVGATLNVRGRRAGSRSEPTHHWTGTADLSRIVWQVAQLNRTKVGNPNTGSRLEDRNFLVLGSAEKQRQCAGVMFTIPLLAHYLPTPPTHWFRTRNIERREEGHTFTLLATCTGSVTATAVTAGTPAVYPGGHHKRLGLSSLMGGRFASLQTAKLIIWLILFVAGCRGMQDPPYHLWSGQ